MVVLMMKMPGYELVGKEERDIVAEIFNKNNGVLFGHGFDGIRSRYYVKEFENNLSLFFHNSGVASTSSGTSAIFCSLKAVGIREGDEVITQGFNFAATAEAIVACNAKVIIGPHGAAFTNLLFCRRKTKIIHSSDRYISSRAIEHKEHKFSLWINIPHRSKSNSLALRSFIIIGTK